jgi:two-component system chemotaxis sensor kinase CheA
VDLRTQREFLIDIEELVEQLFAGTEELRDHEGQGPLRREVLARIFRHVHSIKGVAATAGFNQVSELAHQTETLLAGARSGRIAIEDAFVDTLDEAANAISESLSAVAAGAEAAPPSALLQRLHNLAPQDTFAESRLPPDLPADIAASLNASEKQLLLEALRENETLYLVTADFDVAVFDKEFHELRTTLTRHGAVISSLPSAENSRPDRVGFHVFYSSDLKLADLQERLATFPQVAIKKLPHETLSPSSADRARVTKASLPSSFIRIEVEELDRLIAASHELFSQTVAALDLISGALKADPRPELKDLDAQIRQSLVSLEEQIIQLRMISLERVMQRAVRAGRVAARVSGKQIEFSTAGSRLRIDKIICDAIADPLLHLVRNAVDQGIETPEERVRAGKEQVGAVRVEASSAGGRVRFVVSDDGRGIDPKVVSHAAAKLGLIENGTLLSSEMSLRLIFRPGFSTALSLSSVSGRGVGLAVVESAVEHSGGAVRVRTQVGKGTEFEIRLPATLGFLRALVIVSNGHRYCVDASQIFDHVEAGTAKIQLAGSIESLCWRAEVLPLVELRKLLAQSSGQSKSRLPLLICKLPSETSEEMAQLSTRHAVVVDAIGESQEVLVRSLGRHAALWPGVVGAAELRDGTVALVLDLPLLLTLELSQSGLD